MDLFAAWNLALLKTYFSLASAGEEVWLTVDPDELDAIAPELGGDKGFVEAVRAGPLWPTVQEGRMLVRGTSAQLLERAEGLLRQRRYLRSRPEGYADPGELSPEYEGTDAPCFLPILAALVRNCARQTDSSYYPVLQADLLLPASWGSPQMSQLGVLWQDLQHWSEQNKGRFGRFKYRRIGGLTNVGVPRSQVTVSRRDARALTRVFAQAGVRAGQAPSESVLNDIVATAREVNFLSTAFTEALDKPEFAQPIRDRITTLLEDWDGVVAAPTRESIGVDQERAQRQLGVEVALGLQPGNLPPWEVRWRIPALRDAGVAHLVSDRARWTAEFSGTETVTSQPGDEAQREAARALLAASAVADQRCELVMAWLESSSGSSLGDIILPRRILRSFVPEREITGPRGQAILLERPLPATGNAYLLAAADNASRLSQFLQRNAIHHNACATSGLPDGSVLVHIPDCSELADLLLPDGEQERSRPSVVRLVGGRMVQRGAGRQYLSFDLPIVELDAPHGTSLQAAGLELLERDEESASTKPGGLVTALSSLRRFEIQLRDREVAAFEIRAIHDGAVIGRVRLRLAADSGLAVSSGRTFALDPYGHASTDPAGLRGVLYESALVRPHADQAYHALHVHLGWPVHPSEVPTLQSCAAARFLDTLGRLGSIGFGQARDQLRRLSDPGGPDPYVVLRELRGRGFLEIESNSRGHWVRIHAVNPFLNVLPVVSDRGSVVAALGGTLRLEHWRVACSGAHSGVTALRELEDLSPVLPAIRLAATSMQALEQLSATLGSGIAVEAATRIANWSASIDEVRSELLRGGVESLGAGSRHVDRFVAPLGLFSPSELGTTLRLESGCELFQVEDTDTGSHWIYVLGFRDESGRPRYTFVRDARWGIWIALAASAEWARTNFGRDDLYPWPLHYDAATRTLWLPKRLNLPVVLERALMLCSGAVPTEEKVSRSPANGAVGLSHEQDGRNFGAVSFAYQEYVPNHPSFSRWLGYRWVPPAAALAIARKVGGVIRPLMLVR